MLREHPLDEPVIRADTPAPAPSHRAERQPPADRAWLGITAFVVSVCTWAFSGDRVMFHLLPDEPGALAMARWMAGRNRWNMFDHSTWQPALSILLTPAYLVTDDPEALVRWGLAVNAVVMGAAAAVTVLLAQRLGGLPTRTAALFSIAVALTPGALSGAGYLWAEPLVVASFVTATYAAIRTLDGDDDGDDGDGIRWATMATTVAALGYLAHGRLLPFACTTIVVVAAGQLRLRRRRAALVASCAGLATLGAVWLATWLVHSKVWDETGRVNTAGSVFKRLDDPVEVADRLVGQLWYLLVATLGVGAIGSVVVVRALRADAPRARGSSGGIDRRAAIAIVALTTPQLMVSAAFLVGRSRADQVVYGRYNEAVFWPVLIVGLCWLRGLAADGWTRRRAIDAAAAMVAIGATAAAVEGWHGDVLAGDIGLRPMVAGLLPFVGRTDAVPVVGITFAAVVAMAALLAATTWLRTRPRALAPIAMALCTALLVAGGVRTHHGESRLLNGWTRLVVVREIERFVPPDTPLAVKTVRDQLDPSLSWERQRHRYQIFQLYLPHRVFLRDRGLTDEVGPYVFAPRDDPALTAAGAIVLWEDPTADLDLYLEPTRPSDRPGVSPDLSG